MKSPSPRRVVVLLMLVAAGLLAMATGAQAIVYGLESTADLTYPSVSPTNLFSFNETSPGLTVYGSLKIGVNDIDADGLAYSPTHGLLGYELQKGANNLVTGSQLIQITVQTNPYATTISTGLLSGKDIRGAAFINGHLWVLDHANNQYLEINPSTGAVISTHNFTTSGFTLTDLTDLAPRANGVNYLVNLDKFYTFDLATGAVTLVHTDQTAENQFVGIAFSLNAPSDRLFSFEVGGTDDIFYHNADNLAGVKTLLYGDFSPSFNSGRGDLASNVPIPGAVWLLGSGLLGLVGLRRKFTR